MTPTPRTDDCYRRAGMMLAVQVDELDRTCRELEVELATKDAQADEIYWAAVALAAKLEDDIAAATSERDALRKTADKLDADKEFNARLCESLAAELVVERKLADRLASGCDALLTGYSASSWDSPMDPRDVDRCAESLADWKEARK